MPRVELPHQPELTPALVADILRRRMPELEVRDTKLLGADLLAFQSQALGATLKVKQQPDKQRTLIVVGGLVPNLGLRILLVLIVIIPLLILTLVAHTGVAQRIAEMLEQEPELHGGGTSLPPSATGRS